MEQQKLARSELPPYTGSSRDGGYRHDHEESEDDVSSIASSSTSHQRNLPLQSSRDDQTSLIRLKTIGRSSQAKVTMMDKGSRSGSQADFKLKETKLRYIRDIVGEFWAWEAAAGVFGIASLCSIAGVLIYENDRPLDHWTLAIASPNAVVSFLGTLGKAAIVLILSQVLSQLKWLHFLDARRLEELAIFDRASRDPLGAWQVIWHSKRILASITAFLMILTLLFDPFIQLVFSFPTRPAIDHSQQALFQKITFYSGDPGLLAAGQASRRVWSGVNAGLAQAPLQQAATCPSGTCTWPDTIQTLGVCGSCNNVTTEVKLSCSTSNATGSSLRSCSYTFPSGNVLWAYRANLSTSDIDGQILISSTLWNSTTGSRLGTKVTPGTSLPLDDVFYYDSHGCNNSNMSCPGNQPVMDGSFITFDAIQPPLLLDNTTLGSIYGGEISSAVCWNCQFFWCEQTFSNISVTNAEPLTSQVTTRRLWYITNFENSDLPLVNSNEFPATRIYMFYPEDIESLRASGNASRFNYSAHDTLSAYLETVFNSFYAGDLPDGHIIPVVAAQSSTWPADLQYNPGFLASLIWPTNLTARIEKVANSITEGMRTENYSQNITGHTWVMKSFIQVSWGWLALPLALTVLTCILLPIVAIASQKNHVTVWKDDPIALLCHRIHGVDIVSESDNQPGPAYLKKLAQETYVKLDQESPLTFVQTPNERKFGAHGET